MMSQQSSTCTLGGCQGCICIHGHCGQMQQKSMALYSSTCKSIGRLVASPARATDEWDWATSLQGIPRRQVAAQAAALLGRVRLTEAAGVRSGAYSGGMRRRLSVAIALLGAGLRDVCLSDNRLFAAIALLGVAICVRGRMREAVVVS